MKSMKRSLVVLALATTFASLATPVLAGPPLLCHPFDIGTARSLPWGSGQGWQLARADYDRSHLATDTTALINANQPVVVRMETLRRAAIYAASDRAAAAQLLTALTARTRGGSADAWFDAGYFTETLRQIGVLKATGPFGDGSLQMASLVKDVDGQAMIDKALLLDAGEPGFELGAALVHADKNRGVYLEHAKRARAGAARDELVARNIDMVQ